MVQQTSTMKELLPEFPFLLRDEQTLIDGTIDLLCETAHGFTIFDYKFTEADNDKIKDQYTGQMELYRKAALKKYPAAKDVKAALIVVSHKGARSIPVDF